MSNVDIIRAWKDAEYRDSLSAEQRASLPQHPALELAFGSASTVNSDGCLSSYCTPCTAVPSGYASEGTVNSDGCLTSHCTPCSSVPAGYL